MNRRTNEFHYSVIEFILSDLENDSIVFNNPVYQKMLDLARVNCNKEGFVSQHFFFNNQDIEISKTAIDLVAEKYTLSKIHTKFAVIQEEIDILPELIKRSLYELKDAIIRKEVKDINAKIKQANSSGDVSQLNEYMNTLMELHKIRTELAKELGERIVTRF